MIVQLRPATIVTTAVVVLASLTPLFAVFDGIGWALRLATAVIAATAVAVAIETRAPDRELPWLSIATAGGAVLWAMIVLHGSAFASDPLSGDVWSRVGNGFLDGWSELLGAAEPTADLDAAETLLGFLVWFGTAFGISVAARRRSPAGVLVAAATITWVSAAAALGGDGEVIAGALVGGASLFAIAAIGRTDVDQWRGWRIAGLAAMIAGAGLVAAIVVALGEPVQRDPFDPRNARDTAVRTLEVPDLLSEYAGRVGATGEVFTVDRVLGDPDVPIRLRLQAFGEHDGRRFLPVAEYTDVTRLAQGSDASVGEQYVLDITLRGLDGPFLPTLDRVIRTDLGDLGWDPETQTAVRQQRPGRYQLTGAAIDPSAVATADADRSGVDAIYLALPENIPASFRTTALSATAGVDGDRAAVAAIAGLVRSFGRDPSAPSGHSLGRLDADLQAERAGSAEQLATLQTLLLRAAGIPARPVVGYVATGDSVAATALDIWVEVPYVDVGWVPTETVTAVLDAPIAAGDQVSTTTVPAASDVAAQAQPRELGPTADPLDIGADDGGLSLGDLVLGLVGLVALAFAAAVLARDLRRRSRRHAPTGDKRTLGAWAELIDRLREAGLRPGPTTTVSDVVELTAGLDPQARPAVEALARRTAEVFHGPWDTPMENGDNAWHELEQIESHLRDRQGPGFDVRRVIDLRTLRHRGPEPPTNRDGGRRRVYVIGGD